MNSICSQALCWILAVVVSGPPQQDLNWKEEEPQVVPIEVANGFLIEFKGSIGELNNLRFILDTGTTHSIVDRKIAEKLGIRLHPTKLIDFDRNSSAREGIFPEVSFGPVLLKDVSLLAADLSEISLFAHGADAIIGSDLLRLHSFVIDYEEMKLSFRKSGLNLASIQPHASAMLLQLRIQEHPLNLLLDTGVDGIVLFEDRLRSAVPNLLIQGKEKAIMIGPRTQATLATLPGIYLGTEAIDSKVFLVKGPRQDVLPDICGYLGTSALKARRMEFDIAGNQFKWR